MFSIGEEVLYQGDIFVVSSVAKTYNIKTPKKFQWVFGIRPAKGSGTPCVACINDLSFPPEKMIIKKQPLNKREQSNRFIGGSETKRLYYFLKKNGIKDFSGNSKDLFCLIEREYYKNSYDYETSRSKALNLFPQMSKNNYLVKLGTEKSDRGGRTAIYRVI